MEKLLWLVKYLINENPKYKDRIEIPTDENELFNLYRSLVNVRMPEPISNEYLRIEDEYLSSIITPVSVDDFEEISIWQGDITTLKADAIVNAANSQMLGCFAPLHACIDNCIHTFSGVRLRLTCNDIMKKQGKAEETGKAKITPAYNLPSKYVIHTVGPIIDDVVSSKDIKLLSSCYYECLKLADENNCKSIAFCCISTGVFKFPNRLAAKIAINTVKEYKKETNSKIKVIFNVFKDTDYEIYRELLG